MMKRKLLLTTLTFFGFYFVALCGVNLKNGNYYVSYTDAIIDSEAPFSEIARTYNSKSTEIGIFGYGWGTIFETKMSCYPDGTILVNEHGSGGETLFTSLLATDDLIEIMIDELIEIGIEEGDIENSPEAIIQKRDTYFNKISTRRYYWDKYVEKGLLEYASDFPVDMEWESHQRGNQKIVKTENGFERFDNQEIESFNKEGKLVKFDKGNNYWSEIQYVKGNISKIKLSTGEEFIFSVNEDGFITEIQYGEKKTKYEYDGNDLVLSKDLVGNQYQFFYDSKHNMTKIVYNPVRFKGEPEEAQIMEYDPKTGFVTKITDRYGNVVEYEYANFYKEDGSKDDNHYKTVVTKENYYGEKVSNTYEYVIGVKANGQRFTNKIITEINGIKTSTTYDELCGLPTEIIRGNRSTSFKYNNRCLLVEKLTDSDSIYMKYHPSLEKMTYVKNNKGETHFEYDDKGNLTYAKNETEWARLTYNDDGKIVKMEQEDKTLDFVYNEKGKPIKITMKDVGSIDVIYDSYGEIENVSSEQGHQMALQISQSFQSIINMVKPSGVNLGM